MFSTFDLRLLLYVIRLAGWLKHCNLSLSLSHMQTLIECTVLCLNPVAQCVQSVQRSKILQGRGKYKCNTVASAKIEPLF